MRSNAIELSVVRTGCAVAIVVAVALRPAVPSAADDLLARSRAAYAALRSYADTGVLTNEMSVGGPPIAESATFKTYFRAPRHFYFDFAKNPKTGEGRFVVWSDAEAFHTWWSTTGVDDTYPPGTGVTAFVIASTPTGGAVLAISPLLFPQAGLMGGFEEIDPTTVVLAGTESVNGHPCHKLTAVSRSTYQATGHVTNVRKSAVWVDLQTLLVRKMFNDTPRGSGAGTILRSTVIFEPQANPTLDDAKFKFTVPTGQQ